MGAVCGGGSLLCARKSKKELDVLDVYREMIPVRSMVTASMILKETVQ